MEYLNIKIIDDQPEIIEENTFYIIGSEKIYEWLLTYICPCGCKDIVQLNLLKAHSPCWNYKINNNKITVNPSIQNRIGCLSHYIIKDNEFIFV